MVAPHELERAVGVEAYASRTPGIGGRLRAAPADFRVVEREDFDAEPLDASPDAYPWLVLRVTLEGVDTNEFARTLSNAAGISRERVSWAGTKDANAVSTQLFTVRGLAPADVPEVRPDAVEIEIVGRAGRGIHLGDLLGNEFEIVVRDVEHPERIDDISAELEEFAGGRPGFPNFFGQQRFGSYRPVTHEVGLAILRRDWEGAAMAYLGAPSAHEPEDSRRAREFVTETRDWQTALERFPNRLRYERAMLHSLVDTGGDAPEDFRAALDTFPENLQRLFVHAAQSLVFNRILSERLSRDLPFAEPVVGDVVCFADRDAPEDIPLPDPDRTQVATEDRLDVLARHCRRERAFVTAPLPGTETALSDEVPGEIARAVLDDLELDTADFDLPEPYGSAGTRRAILVPVSPTIDREPITFSFTLPKGAYATAFLREYVKGSPLDL
ncbi:MAG: tRNA pseudouridine(13) synthase TruD [Halodesulfurarchaeum sp.]